MNLSAARIYILLFFLIASCQTIVAQTGNLRGQIITSDGIPVENVTVSVAGINKKTVSSESGHYDLSQIDIGNQRITFSFTGLKTEERYVIITEGEISILNMSLVENAFQLQEVIVNSNKNAQPPSSAKSGIANRDLPQTTGVVNNTMISDQQAIRVGDVIKNVSGVSLTQTRLGVNETYTSRGYSIGNAGGAGSIFKNGLVSNTAGMPEAATLESIEVMKGSTALLYGNVSGGLIVNLVTKKPKFTNGGEIKMMAGSYGMYKPVVDLYGPINRHIAFRIVGSYEDSRSFRDNVNTNRTYINPSLLFRINKKTTLLVQGDFLKAQLTPDFGIGALDSGRVLPKGIPISRFHNVLWAYNNVEQNAGSVAADHMFNERWKINLSASVQRTGVDSYGAGLPNTISKTGDWTRTLARAKTGELNKTAQLNLVGKFKTGVIKHQMLAGADITRIETRTNAYRITSNGAVVAAYDRINILEPSLYTGRNDIPDANVTTITTAPSNRLGVYAQDLVSLSDKLKLLAGLRWSSQKTVQTKIFSPVTKATTRGPLAAADNRAFSPKVAVVYQPYRSTSVFASYSNNFTINTGTDIYGSLLTPSIIDQYEIGIKNSFLKDKLSVNLSVYNIKNNNLAQQAEFKADGSFNSDATVKELKGQTTSEGIEIDMNAFLSKSFYVVAGYGYNNMRFTNTSGSKGSNIEGERLINNPQNTANLAVSYTLTKGSLKNLKLGIASFYTGNRFGGYNNIVGQSQSGSRLIPLSGFATLDCSAGYSIKQFSLLFKVSNIFNTRNYLVHDNYSIAPVAPRQIVTSLSYKLWNKK